MFESDASGSEHRAESFAKTYSAIRLENECARYWYRVRTRLHPPMDRIPNTFEWAEAPSVIEADDGLQLYVEAEQRGAVVPDLGPVDLISAPGGPMADRLSLYRRISTGSATTSLPLGTHYFALGYQGSPLGEIPVALTIDQPMLLRPVFQSSQPRRIVGASLAAGGIGTLLLVTAPSAVAAVLTDGSLARNVGYVSLGVGLASVIVGTIIALTSPDEVALNAIPLNAEPR